MAVAKSTIILASPSTSGVLVKWSTIASAANNTYFDVNNKDCSKIIFAVLNTNSSDVGTTAGFLYFGSSASACSGTSYAKTYSGGIKRMRVKCSPPTTPAKEAMAPSSTAAKLSISLFGPYESAQFKDSNGYIKVSKVKATSDLGRVKIAAILIP
jgi:hypothetical protein